jgi:hypothetical protein
LEDAVGTSRRGNVLTGAAGEDYVLYQLHLRNVLAAAVPTGAAIADLIVFDPRLSVGSMVQVKTSTRPRTWVLSVKSERPEYVHPRLFYALVYLPPNAETASAAPEVFIVPSAVVANVLTVSTREWLARPGVRGQPHNDNPVRSLMRRYPWDVPGYPPGWLDKYRDRWDYLTSEPDAPDVGGA